MGGEAKARERAFAREMASTPVEWVAKEIRPLIIQPGEYDVQLHLMPGRRVPDDILQNPVRAREYFVQVKKAADPKFGESLIKFGPAGQEHLYSYWGHIPSPDCKCGPKPERQGESVVYTHVHSTS